MASSMTPRTVQVDLFAHRTCTKVRIASTRESDLTCKEKATKRNLSFICAAVPALLVAMPLALGWGGASEDSPGLSPRGGLVGRAALDFSAKAVAPGQGRVVLGRTSLTPPAAVTAVGSGCMAALARGAVDGDERSALNRRTFRYLRGEGIRLQASTPLRFRSQAHAVLTPTEGRFYVASPSCRGVLSRSGKGRSSCGNRLRPTSSARRSTTAGPATVDFQACCTARSAQEG